MRSSSRRQLGDPLPESTLRVAYRAALARAGLPRIRFHDLRHTAATIALGRGVHPKVVSEMLGHSRTAITPDLYSHVTPTMQREAVSAMEAALGGRA
jgi:integrase